MNKKTLLLGGVFVLLLALAFIYSGPFQKWKTDMSKPKNMLAQIDMDQLDSIDITKEGKTSSLARVNNNWIFNDGKIPASQALIDQLITALKTSKDGNMELVSSNQGKKKDFETDGQGIQVKLKQGKNEVNFTVGKQSSDFVYTYFSKTDSADTYAIKVSIVPYLTQAEWRDTAIFKSDKGKIDKLRFQYPDREFVIEKNGDKWQGVAPIKFPASSAKLEKILEIMSNLSAVSIPEQNYKGTGLEKNLLIVEASGEGISNLLMVGNAKGDSFYAKKGDSDALYLIAKEQKKELDKRVADLK